MPEFRDCLISFIHLIVVLVLILEQLTQSASDDTNEDVPCDVR
jgi:hypothetical protein